LMDALVAYLPSPDQRPIVMAKTPKDVDVHLSASSTGPLVVYVWKTVADPYVGKVSYFRVISGTLHGDIRLWSMPGSNEERLSQVFAPRGKEQLAVTELAAGDIGGVTKLANTGTNDTLSEKAISLELPRPVYPEPLYSVAISPKTKADSAKMGPALSRVTEEDPSLSWRQEQGTNETILSGMGEQHIGLPSPQEADRRRGPVRRSAHGNQAAAHRQWVRV
jgi:elongation factor G